jgi:hypothetical protein
MRRNAARNSPTECTASSQTGGWISPSNSRRLRCASGLGYHRGARKLSRRHFITARKWLVFSCC